jgi:hypothetical protein
VPEGYTSGDFDDDLNNKTTDDILEGLSNLYYSDSLVDSHLSGGTGIDYSNGIITHADTSSVSSVNNSDSSVIQDISVDDFGHVTAIGSKSLSASDVGALPSAGKAADAEQLDGLDSSQFLRSDADNNFIDFANNEQDSFDVDGRLYWDLSAGLYIKSSNSSSTAPRLLWSGANVSSGSGISISYGSEDKPTISHSDTSNASSVNNSGGTVIQDISIDDFGHITGTTSKTLNASDVGALPLNAKADDSDRLDSLNSTQFLRSDVSDVKTGGSTRFNDNVELYFGNSNEVTFAWDGARFYTNIINNDDWYIRDSGTDRFLFDVSSGDFHADGDVIAFSTSVSDERLKEKITTVTQAVKKVKQLDGVTFTRTHNGEKSAGLIAQQLEKILPEAVKEKSLPLITGSDDELYKTVEYDAVHALLIESVKELSERLEVLERKNGSS